MSTHHDETIHKLYHEYGVYIYKFCLSRLKDQQTAQDCMQETFFVALDKLIHTTEEIREPKKWLTAIAAYTIKSFIKKQALLQKHFVSMEQIDTENLHATEEENQVIEKIIAEKVNIDSLSTAIKNQLTPKERDLYQKRFIEKQSVTKIAEEESISYSAATTRINRMKYKIADIIKKTLHNIQFFL